MVSVQDAFFSSAAETRVLLRSLPALKRLSAEVIHVIFSFDCTHKGTGMRVFCGKLPEWHEWLHTNMKP